MSGKDVFIWRQMPRIYTTLDYLLSEEGKAQEKAKKKLLGLLILQVGYHTLSIMTDPDFWVDSATLSHFNM
jgi:hypothetical protein